MARRHLLQDLDPYEGCELDDSLGITPLAVGWLDKRQPFETGEPTPKFVEKLAGLCSAENTVCPLPAQRPCPLCGKKVEPFGSAEIRTIGDEEIYAAPDLIHHFVTAHDYAPPAEFVDSVLKGPGVDSAEYRALINFYQ